MAMPLKQAAAIRHVPFEDLGTFEPALREAGYEIRYVEAGFDELGAHGLDDAELLVVLGGPIGAYEQDSYPFLADELALLERRLKADRPTLGICLGAQLIARALGSSVYPTGVKEIGWGPLELSAAGHTGVLRHLDRLDVLHWHGDTFDLPIGCDQLASTAICRNQAFARGSTLLALQFHPEVDERNIERWLIGHACELAGAGIAPPTLRARTREAARALRPASDALIAEWLQGVG
jgi:GMP synthase (glutamine-hydrolysing)